MTGDSTRSSRVRASGCGRTERGPAFTAPGPMSYMLDGRQYVLIPSGVTIVAFALPEK